MINNMNYTVFKEKVEPLIDVISKICKENNIEYLSQFNLGNNLIAHYRSDDMVLSPDTTFAHLQLWKAKQKIDSI